MSNEEVMLPEGTNWPDAEASGVTPQEYAAWCVRRGVKVPPDVPYPSDQPGLPVPMQLPDEFFQDDDERLFPANPKLIRALKDGKAPMEYLPYSVLESEARVLAHGAAKYGARNWRIDKILASTYEGAMLRHFLAWAQGEDIDPDSGEPHLTHLRACCAVVLDAEKHGTLIDDRGRQESKDQDA